MPRAAAAGVLCEPSDVSRHRSCRLQTLAHVTQRDDICVLWRRLLETVSRSYNADFASVTAATGLVVRVCASDGQMLAAMSAECRCCGWFVSTSHTCPEHFWIDSLRAVSADLTFLDWFASFDMCGPAVFPFLPTLPFLGGAFISTVSATGGCVGMA